MIMAMMDGWMDVVVTHTAVPNNVELSAIRMATVFIHTYHDMTTNGQTTTTTKRRFAARE
jgi:hypothetical protein